MMIQAPNPTAMPSPTARKPQVESLHQSIGEEKEDTGSETIEADRLYEKLKELEAQWVTQRCILALSYNLDDDPQSTSSLSGDSCQNDSEEKSEIP